MAPAEKVYVEEVDDHPNGGQVFLYPNPKKKTFLGGKTQRTTCTSFRAKCPFLPVFEPGYPALPVHGFVDAFGSLPAVWFGYSTAQQDTLYRQREFGFIPTWRGGRRRGWNSARAVRTGWACNRPIFTRRRGVKPRNLRPLFPDGVPVGPKRKSSTSHRSAVPSVSKRTVTRQGGSTTGTPMPSTRSWLMSHPELVDGFFGHRPDKVDRYHSIKASVKHRSKTRVFDRKVDKSHCTVSNPPGCPDVDVAKLSPVIAMVRPIPVFNGQNHKPVKPGTEDTTPKKDNHKNIKRRKAKSARLPMLTRSKYGGNMKHPAPKWVAETRSPGLLSGFAATDVNHAAHCINGNISLSGTTSIGLNDGTGVSTGHTFQSPRWTQSGPRVRMMSLETDLAASSSARDQRSRSPSSAVNRRVGSTAPQTWTRALLDSGADCCVCGTAMTAGRFVALDQLPAGTQLPQSSQGFPMDVTGLRLVTMRLGEFVLEMEFWVCRSSRRTIQTIAVILLVQ